MRGQVAMELFLIVAMVSVVLFWLGNYADEWQRGQVAVVALEEKMLASSLARLINRANASALNITHNLPCLRKGSEVVVYTINASGTLLNVSSVSPSSEALALLAYSANGSLSVGCVESALGFAGAMCLSPEGGVVQLRGGACPT